MVLCFFPSSSCAFLPPTPFPLPVPCVPVNVSGVVDCSTSTFKASWAAAAGAVSYISTLKGPGGFSSSCPTADQRCSFPDLQCAQTYMFSVVAVNALCNSSESAKISGRTGKCAILFQGGNLSLLFGAYANTLKDIVPIINESHEKAQNKQ